MDLVELGAGREKSNAQANDSESKFTRYRSEASIFISLFEHLSATGVVRSVTETLPNVGELISIETGPAAAPLRRELGEMKRFLDVANSAKSLPGAKQDLADSIRGIEGLVNALLRRISIGSE